MPRKKTAAKKPPITLSLKKRDIQKTAAQSGVTPLEVILDVMRAAYENEDRDMALAAAKLAAPYLHSRYQESEHKNIKDDPVQIIIGWMENQKEKPKQK